MKEADRTRLINDPFPNAKFWDEFSAAEQVGTVRRSSDFVQCKKTGALFEASYAGFLDVNPLFQKREDYPHFYLREVVLERGSWWEWRRWRFRRTGRVWRPKPGTFRLFNDMKHAVECSLRRPTTQDKQ